MRRLIATTLVMMALACTGERSGNEAAPERRFEALAWADLASTLPTPPNVRELGRAEQREVLSAGWCFEGPDAAARLEGTLRERGWAVTVERLAEARADVSATRGDLLLAGSLTEREGCAQAFHFAVRKVVAP